MKPDNSIIFNQVSKRYAGGQAALSQVSFNLAAGEMAFLTGHSGAGKSTLLKLIAMMEQPSGGEIIYHGVNTKKIGARKIPQYRRSMGIVLQNPNLLMDRTVFDNVALPLIIAHCRYQEIAKRVRAALEKVNLLRKERCFPDALSSGEQQRVSIARAIVHKPSLLLADEPTGNLDPDLSVDIMSLFEAFNQIGVSVLIASHDLSLIAKLPHRLLTLQQGRLLEQGALRAGA